MTKSVCIFLLLLSSVVFAQPDVPQIIARSVEANKADWKARPEYDFSERVQTDGHSKTYDVLMIFGSPYQRLVAVDGKPLSPRQEGKEEAKLKQTIAQRRNETPEQRKNRVADWQRSEKRNHFLIEQLTKAFDFKLQGTQELNGHEVYVLSATPRSGYNPPTKEAKVLTGMKGTLWIDRQTFQWVKVEARVVHPVSIEGFLAHVEPGTRFSLQQAPVSPDIWLPTFFAVKSRAKMFFFVPHNEQEQDSYFNYRKASTVDALSGQ